jgi:hypothetical protein
MAPDSAARASGRPHPALLVALAAVVLLLVWWNSGKSAAPSAVPSQPRAGVNAKQNAPPADAGDLNVRLDALKQPRPVDGVGSRNPFRFYTPPPPPPAPSVASKGPVPPLPQPEGPPVQQGPPPPPPIPLKYIGLLDGVPGQGKVAAFSDCRTTMHAREGEIIGGQYRLVHIGAESAVLEYVDGRGRTTIRQSGQECVGK